MRRGTGSSSANASGNLNAPQQQQQQQYQQQQSQYPQQQGARPSPSLPSITRSASPSGLSGFFSKPTKWFTRQNSNSKISPVEPRPSTSSISSSRRRPTISGPTDPRPIETLPTPRKDGKLGGGLASLNDRASRCVHASSHLILDNSCQNTPEICGSLTVAISDRSWIFRARVPISIRLQSLWEVDLVTCAICHVRHGPGQWITFRRPRPLNLRRSIPR